MIMVTNSACNGLSVCCVQGREKLGDTPLYILVEFEEVL